MIYCTGCATRLKWPYGEHVHDACQVCGYVGVNIRVERPEAYREEERKLLAAGKVPARIVFYLEQPNAPGWSETVPFVFVRAEDDPAVLALRNIAAHAKRLEMRNEP
jgi:hypothetical protein